ncbi:MAG: tetratricopeptide repeat protein [Pseudomonadota bacterium]
MAGKSKRGRGPVRAAAGAPQAQPAAPGGYEDEVTVREVAASEQSPRRPGRVRPVLPPKPDTDPMLGEEPPPTRPHFTVELVGDQVGQAMSQIVHEAQYWLNKGRYNKVRVTRAGKPLLPDIPVGALLAIEAATFFWAGMLRGVVANIAGNVLFEVELINDAKEHLNRGRKLFLDGELDEAQKAMQLALEIDERDAEIHMGFASLLKARGLRGRAVGHYRRVIELDREGNLAEEARHQLEKLGIDL